MTTRCLIGVDVVFSKEGLMMADVAMAAIDEDEIEPTTKITDIAINNKVMHEIIFIYFEHSLSDQVYTG
jgi:hypothetical protein